MKALKIEEKTKQTSKLISQESKPLMGKTALAEPLVVEWTAEGKFYIISTAERCSYHMCIQRSIHPIPLEAFENLSLYIIQKQFMRSKALYGDKKHIKSDKNI